jgi:hypothetical protein
LKAFYTGAKGAFFAIFYWAPYFEFRVSHEAALRLVPESKLELPTEGL